MKSIIFSVLVVLITVFACNSNRKIEETAQPNVVAKDDLKELLSSNERYNKVLEENGIGILEVWSAGDSETDQLIYLTKKQPADEKNYLGGEFLRIYDSKHKLIFEESALFFGGIEVMPILRKSRRQLVIKSIDNGGSGRFFQILDFQGGKIVRLTNDDETLYTGEIAIFPQYQNGQEHYNAPYQVLANDQLISPSPTAFVFRFSNGKYRIVGELDLLEVGKSIDRNTIKR